MTAAIERTIANDVVTAFNAVTWSPVCAATRTTIVDVDAVNTTLAASVMVTAWATDDTRRTRGEDALNPKVGIAIHQRVDDVELTTIDPLLDLLADIRRHFARWISPNTNAAVIGRTAAPVYNEELLRKHLMFVGFLELEFLAFEVIP